MRAVDFATLFPQEEQEMRRRGQRTGYLKKIGPSWFLQYRKGKVDRHRVTVRVGAAKGFGKLTRKQAERIAWDSFLSMVDQVTIFPKSRQTVEHFVRESFEPGLVWTLKPSGKAHYGRILGKHVLPTLGKFELGEVAPQDIQALIRAKLAAGLSVQTALHIKNAISAIFRYAKGMRAYSGDLPTEGVRMPAVQAVERRSLNWPQVQMIAAELPEQVEILVIVLTLTGLRIGEAVALRWKRVNLDGEPKVVDGEILPAYTLAVRENHVLGQYGTLKTPKSRRNIPLSAEAWIALSRLQPGAPDAPVFANRVGKPIDWRNIAMRFLKPTVKRLGLPWVSFHTLRVTNATLADQAGLSVSERQRILGHSSAAMTMHYTKPELETMRERMEMIGGKPN